MLVGYAYALDPNRPLNQLSIFTWGQKEGIVWPQIWSLAQTPDGYLWLGTNGGLVRFDGTKFEPWMADQGAPLAARFVLSLMVARNGDLWMGFGISGGVAVLHAGQLREFRSSDGIPEGSVTQLLEAGDGSIWASTFGGLARWKHGKWESGAGLGLPAGRTTGVSQDHDGNIWVVMDAGALRLRRNDSRFELVYSGHVQALTPDEDGSLWLADLQKGPLRFDTRTGRITPLSGIPPAVVSLRRDRDGNLWMGTAGSGLYRSNGRSVERLTRVDGLSSDIVYCILEDHDGNVWTGTPLGLSRLRQSVFTPLSNRETLPDGNVTAVAASPDGTMWIGSATGLTRLTSAGRRTFTVRDGLPGVPVLTLLDNGKGRLWAGTVSGLAWIEGDRVTPVVLPKMSRLRSILALGESHDGSLWIGGQHGLARWKGGEFTEVTDPAVAGKQVSSILIDPEDRVWIGTPDPQLAVYEAGRLRIYGQEDRIRSATSATAQRNGTLWFGGRQGLSRWRSGRFVHFPSHPGGYAEPIPGLIEDNDGNLWIAGSSGILRVARQELESVAEANPQPLRGRRFDSSEGLRAGPIRYGHASTARDVTGRLWFVTGDGVVTVDPAQFRAARAPSPVIVTALQVDGRAMPLSGAIRLPAHTQRIQIDYSAVNLSDPEKLLFRHRLDGFDPQWVDVGSRRQAFFTGLSPGTYQFHVMASTPDGLWNGAEAAFEFTLLPAFYQTGWFFAGCVVFVLSALWVSYRWRVRQVAARLMANYSVRAAERSRIAQELHDTLIQGMQGSSLLLQAAVNKMGSDPQAAQELVERAANQIDETGREARQSLSALRSSTGDGVDAVGSVEESGHRLAAIDDSIQFGVQVVGTRQNLHPVVSEETIRIAVEAIRNAFHHSGGDRIDVTFDFGSTFLVVISDNGKGMDPAIVASGRKGHFGLAGMRERASRIRAKLDIESQPGRGTQVRLSIAGRLAYRRANLLFRDE